MRILIIGNSAAGVGALESIRKVDRNASVTIVSEEDSPAYSRCLLSYFLAGSVDESGLRFRSEDFYRTMDVDVFLGKRVESVDAASQQVVLNDNRRLDYDKLLIATGASAKIPAGIPTEIAGIFVLRTIGDALAIKKAIKPDGDALILGGGLVGMKAAFALAKQRMRVKVVVRSQHVLSQMVDSAAARIVMDRLEENGIDCLTGSDVTDVEASGGGIRTVTVASCSEVRTAEDKRSLPCDLLIAAKGVSPNLGLIEDTDIEINRGIITDANMQTNSENIFAAGDVAETFDVAAEGPSLNALWTCAVQQGRIAGASMVGSKRRYDGSVSMNSINFPGVDLISFGVVRPSPDAGCEVVVESEPGSGFYKKLVLKEGKIKGLILVNAIDTAGVLLSLLRRRVDITDCKGALLKRDFSYGKIVGMGGADELRRLYGAGHSES